MAIEDGKVQSLELSVDSYVYGNVKLDDYENLYHHQDRLIGELKGSILQRIVPGISKLGDEAQQPQQQQQQQQQHEETRRIPPSRYPDPYPSPYDPSPYDPSPLRIGPPRRGYFPYDGGSSFPSPDGHGNLIGPRHPDFFVPHPFSPNSGLPEPLPPGAIPPGARFDPFGPSPPARFPPFRPGNPEGGFNPDMYL